MKIAVGFIDSPAGHAAIDKAIEEAQLRQAGLIVINSKLGGRHDEAEDFIAMAQELRKLEERLAELGVPFETHEYARGMTPSQDILAAADEHGAEMIVIGVRTRSTTGKMLLGSTALEILHDTKLPVLCVKAPPPGAPTRSSGDPG
jgi:nucleotide-binding universal stress UspA family protein